MVKGSIEASDLVRVVPSDCSDCAKCDAERLSTNPQRKTKSSILRSRIYLWADSNTNPCPDRS